MARRIAIGSKRKLNGIFLLIVAVCACVVLTIFNYHTIKVVSSMNSYISGESTYSKHQKDGVRHLMTYLIYEDPYEYELFLQHISIPVSAGDGLRYLFKSSSDSLIKGAMSKGLNTPENIENIIWLYKGFAHYDFMQEAVDIWQQADTLINRLIILGVEINESIPLTATESDSLLKSNFFNEINYLSNELTLKERKFSVLMGGVGRKSAKILFWVNAIVITLMLTTVVVFSNMLIYKLQKSQIKLESINSGFIATNDKLNNFIFATSHELKAPINNLQGLLNLLFMIPATDPVQESIRNKMNASIVVLNTNINRIEQLMLIDSKPDIDVVDINLSELLFHIREENKEFMDAAHVSISSNFKIEEILYSKSGIKEILLNLLSNSIKYKAPDRPVKIEISTYLKDGFLVLKFADNGLGMDVGLHGDQIFGLFKRFHKNLSGSGVGLYLVRQIVKRNGGRISAQSDIGIGTIFELFLQKRE